MSLRKLILSIVLLPCISQASSWSDAWQTKDQQGVSSFEAGDYKASAQAFTLESSSVPGLSPEPSYIRISVPPEHSPSWILWYTLPLPVNSPSEEHWLTLRIQFLLPLVQIDVPQSHVGLEDTPKAKPQIHGSPLEDPVDKQGNPRVHRPLLSVPTVQ